jgi:hypothetical protein
MNRPLIALLCLGLVPHTLAAAEETAVARDRDAILAMAGSFAVSFAYRETVAFQADYTLKDDYEASGRELVIVLEDTGNRIVLQHILETSRGIVKHWRQDWEYQPAELWEFQGDQTWAKRHISEEDAAGTWVQRVFQVDDSPRYEALGRWIHRGNLSQWQSEETFRPLPRREHTKRDDYNILVAINRHAITPDGWVHEQDNHKLRRDGDGDHVIAREIGLNTYRRIDAESLAGARDWWRDNGARWAEVRRVWAELRERESVMHLQKTIDDQPLYEHLFALCAQAGSDSDAELRAAVARQIEPYLVTDAPGSASASSSR